METAITTLNNIMWVFIGIFLLVAVITLIIRNGDLLTFDFFTRWTVIFGIIVILLAYAQVVLKEVFGQVETGYLIYLSFLTITGTALSIKGVIDTL